MPSTEVFLNQILESLSGLENIRYRSMMGEYVIYYREKIVGDICDDRLLVKPTESAKKYLGNAVYESPYPGAKEMLRVDKTYDSEYLCGLFEAMYDDLPLPKTKKKS